MKFSDFVGIIFILLQTYVNAKIINVHLIPHPYYVPILQGNYQGGLNYDSVKAAIWDAQATFSRAPNTVVTIRLPRGQFKLSPPAHKPQAINLAGPQPGPYGRLIIEGVGKRAETILVVPKGFTIIRGRNVQHLTVRRLTLTRDRPLVSQGIIEESGTGYVVLQLPDNIPDDILSIQDPEWGQGRWLRKYNVVNGNCNLDTNNNPQVAYKQVERLGKRKYKFYYVGAYHGKKMETWKEGQMIGIKSKCCNKFGRELYWICGANDIVFESLKFTRSSRGVFRCNVGNIVIRNILIERERGWCLATSGDGPNVGQPEDPPVNNVLIDHVVARGTGDDSIALFNVKSGDIKNCKISDSFARGILLYKSNAVKLTNNILVRNPVLKCDRIPCRDASSVIG